MLNKIGRAMGMCEHSKRENLHFEILELLHPNLYFKHDTTMCMISIVNEMRWDNAQSGPTVCEIGSAHNGDT